MVANRHIEVLEAAEVNMGGRERAESALGQSYCTIGRWQEMEDNPQWAGIALSYTLHPPPAVKRHAWRYYLVDLFASVLATGRVMIALDVFLGLSLTVLSTCVYWFYDRTIGVNMSWTAVSFAVIFPISQGISFSFTRRENALRELSFMLGHLQSIFCAAHTWVVPNKNKDGPGPKWVPVFENYDDPITKRLRMRCLFDALLVAIIAYFDSERWGRARHTVQCIGGDIEQRELMAAAHTSRLQVNRLLDRVRMMNQDLKRVGLAGGEVHRLDQYVTIATAAFERLCAIKEYRTPLAFRAFTRVYILFAGALYGPYFVHLGLGQTGTAQNLWLSLLFACATQLVISGLFRVMLDLEDLFARRKSGQRVPIDVIKVPELVEVTRQQLIQMERELTPSHTWDAPLCESMTTYPSPVQMNVAMEASRV